MGTDANTTTDADTTTGTNTDDDTSGRRLSRFLTTEHVLLTVLAVAMLAGVVVRFLALDARAIHYDEGVHLLETWELATEGTYTYTGFRHGPPLIYLSALLFEVTGTPDIVLARGLVATLSLAVFPALYWLRDDLPPVAIATTAVVLAVHPWVLFAARFYRNDAFVAAGGLLALALYARARRSDWTKSWPPWTTSSRRAWGLAGALGVTLAVAIAAKEIAYLMAAALAGSVLVLTHFDARFSGRGWRAARREYLPLPLVGVTLGVAGLVFWALFSGWPPTPGQALGDWMGGLEVWLTRSSREAYESEVTYYLDQLVRETPVVFGFALVGCLGALRPQSSWVRWPILVWAALVGLVLSFHDHQWLWLMTHVFVPVAVLAGCGVHDTAHALAALPAWMAAATDRLTTLPTHVASTGRRLRTRLPRRRKHPDEWGRTHASAESETAASNGGHPERAGMWARIADGIPLSVSVSVSRTESGSASEGRSTLPAVSVQGVVSAVLAGVVVWTVLAGAAGGSPHGVVGVTAPAEDDIERTAITTARAAAQNTGCSVTLGPDVRLHPAAWYLRETPYGQVDAWNASTLQTDAVFVGRSGLATAVENATATTPAWNGSITAVDDELSWYVAQPAACGG